MKIRDEIVEAFTAGYQAGHEHTVEGTWCGGGLDLAEEYYEEVKGNIPEKRTAEKNGVLPLTPEELEEFDGFLPFIFPEKLSYLQAIDGTLYAVYEKDDKGYPSRTHKVDNYDAIAWILSKFNLEKKNA